MICFWHAFGVTGKHTQLPGSPTIRWVRRGRKSSYQSIFHYKQVRLRLCTFRLLRKSTSHKEVIYINGKKNITVLLERQHCLQTHTHPLSCLSHASTHKGQYPLSSASVKRFIKLCTLVTRSVSNEFSVWGMEAIKGMQMRKGDWAVCRLRPNESRDMYNVMYIPLAMTTLLTLCHFYGTILLGCQWISQRRIQLDNHQAEELHSIPFCVSLTLTSDFPLCPFSPFFSGSFDSAHSLICVTLSRWQKEQGRCGKDYISIAISGSNILLDVKYGLLVLDLHLDMNDNWPANEC